MPAPAPTVLRSVSARFLMTLILTVLGCQLLDPSPPAIFTKRTLRKLLATHHMRLRDPASVRAARRYWQRSLHAPFADATADATVDFQLVRPFKPQSSNEGERWSTALQDDRVIRYAEGLALTPPQPKTVDGGLVTADGKPIITDALVEVQLTESVPVQAQPMPHKVELFVPVANTGGPNTVDAVPLDPKSKTE